MDSQCLWLHCKWQHLTVCVEELEASGVWMQFSVNLIGLVLFLFLVWVHWEYENQVCSKD